MDKNKKSLIEDDELMMDIIYDMNSEEFDNYIEYLSYGVYGKSEDTKGVKTNG